jgi:hypothetical protein
LRRYEASEAFLRLIVTGTSFLDGKGASPDNAFAGPVFVRFRATRSWLVSGIPRSTEHSRSPLERYSENVQCRTCPRLIVRKGCFSTSDLLDTSGQEKRETCTYWSLAGNSKVFDHPGIIVARGWHLQNPVSPVGRLNEEGKILNLLALLRSHPPSLLH